MAPELLENTHLGRAGELFAILLLFSILADLILFVLSDVLTRLGKTTRPVTWARLAAHAASALFSLAMALSTLLVLGLGWQSRIYSAIKLSVLALVALFFYYRARKDLRSLSGRSPG